MSDFEKCQFCKDPVKAFANPRKAHIVLHKDREGNTHVHGDLRNKDDCREMLETAHAEIGLEGVRSEKRPPEEVVFHNRQRLGDMLMFTCGVRDFKAAFPKTRVNVISVAAHIWDNNPAIDRGVVLRFSPWLVEQAMKTMVDDGRGGKRAMKPEEFATHAHFPEHTNLIKVGPSWLTNASNRLDWHFANAFRISMENALGVRIPQGLSRPDIWLTEEEYQAPRLFKEPYWVICTGGERGWACKTFPEDRWQAVVDQNPDLLFVQIGAAGDFKDGKHGEKPFRKLQGKNVIDWVGKTEDKEKGIRDLYKLFLNMEGSIGLVSFHMHLAGALWKPSVVVAGAREPVSFTRYAGHQYIATDGTLPCAVTACWHCALEGCTNKVPSTVGEIPKCVDMIEAEDVTRAIRSYYRGGRLIMGQASEKTPRKYMNIVKTPPKAEAPIVPISAPATQEDSELQKHVTAKYGSRHPFRFGKGSPTEKDWLFLKGLIETHKVKTVLEFGTGLSTLLFQEVAQVTSYETMNHWIERVKLEAPNVDFRLWNGRDANPEPADLAFVDGPSGGVNREHSMRIASEKAKIVVVHDGQFAPEQAWQAKYLKGKFEGPIRGGDRCYTWFHPSMNMTVLQPASVKVKQIRIVSTARGWGGCARSVTTIMKMLLNMGHEVEFVPFRNQVSSREFKDFIANGLKGLKVTNDYSTLKDPCDALLVYADDYVWELGRPEIAEAFTGLQAKRKIMMLNYRRGKVGEIPWTKDWDLYAFLNSGQEKELLGVLPGVKTAVLPPCTELGAFFDVRPEYNHNLRVVRHNSQGDTKFVQGPEDAEGRERVLREISGVLERPDAEISMLPGPSFVPDGERFKKHRRTPSADQIARFLAQGNVFWYSLPPGYMDMGPRVILEAMAAGLPVIADKWGGAVDRVTPDCGWLCETKEEMVEILKRVTPEELKSKGEAARRRAKGSFAPERWAELLLAPA